MFGFQVFQSETSDHLNVYRDAAMANMLNMYGFQVFQSETSEHLNVYRDDASEAGTFALNPTKEAERKCIIQKVNQNFHLPFETFKIYVRRKPCSECY